MLKPLTQKKTTTNNPTYLVWQDDKVKRLPRVLDLLQNRLQASLTARLATDLLHALRMLKRVDLDQLAQGQVNLLIRYDLQHLVDHIPVALLQRRIPQVGDHGHLAAHVLHPMLELRHQAIRRQALLNLVHILAILVHNLVELLRLQRLKLNSVPFLCSRKQISR